MKKLFLILFCFIFCLLPMGCASDSSEGGEEPKTPSYESLSISDMEATGDATVKVATDKSVVPIGVGLKKPPETEVYVVGFNSAGKGYVNIDKSKIKANSYLTFTYFYNRDCTPSIMGVYLLRVKGAVERESAHYGKFTLKHFDNNGKFIAGKYSDKGTIDNRHKGNWLTMEVYFESAPSNDVKFGCVWLANGETASFYLTDVRVSEQSLMQTET